MSGKPSEDERRKEAQEILRRVERDSNPLQWRGALKARDHFAAREAEGQDWTELWGRRVGRALAAIAVFILLLWVWSYLSGGNV